MSPNQFSEEFPGREGKGCHFSKAVILEIVKHVENGVRRSVIVKQYKISRSTIAEWMRDYGSPDYHSRKQGILSQAHKTSVLRAIENGSITVKGAMMVYGITSGTINQWIRAYKREKGELASVMGAKKSSTEKQSEEVSDSEKESLKKALQQAQLQIQALNTLIDVAEDKFKIAIRKKAGAKQSSE
jgi:transposase